MPLIFLRLTYAGILSWHWVSQRSCIQLVLHEPRTFRARAGPYLFTFLEWLRNYAGVSDTQSLSQFHPVPTKQDVFTQQWVYEAVRRLPSDREVDKWMPYMDIVEKVQDLHVTLRPYQKRAAAWMLWREHSTPTMIYDDASIEDGDKRDVVDDIFLKEDEQVSWKRAHDLKSFCPLSKTRRSVRLVSKLAFHGPSEQVWFGDEAQKQRHSIRFGYGGLLCDAVSYTHLTLPTILLV